MAAPRETNNKKQREAKKKKQLQEKKQRAEERKAGKSGSKLEDMFAYLDENGNLTSTPPDPSKRKEIALEDIQISTPKLDDHAAEGPEMQRKGKVSFFDRQKGFGFIQPDNNSERIFFHIQNLQHDVNEGDAVQFDIGRGPRGLQALAVTKAAI